MVAAPVGAAPSNVLPARFRIPGSRLILPFAICNAILYSSLLPLWEGFDEPAHYGYIEQLVIHRQLPLMNRTTLPADIRDSLKLVPVSWLLHNALPGSISFEDWFQLSSQQRRDRRIALRKLSPALATQSSDVLNYEAQQAPLAYLLVAPLDAAFSRAPLPERVLYLRFFVSIVSALLLYAASSLLLTALNVEGAFRWAALACIFESQMLWASIAHVSNDWLSIPLGTLFLALLVPATQHGKTKHLLACAGVLAAGLLTKAYFLAFVPVWAAAMLIQLWRHRLRVRTALGALAILFPAAVWYVRNVFLYGSFSGTQETIAGVRPLDAFYAFFHINWFASTIDLLRWSLWTGNWSFISFSRLTINIELLLLALAFALLFARFRQITEAQWWLLAACFAFYLGLIYQTCTTWIATNGRSQHAEPWYMQCIFPCLWTLAFLGLARSGAIGRTVATLLALISAWIAAATYWVKLIPLSGGFSGRSSVSRVAHWWMHLPLHVLSTTALGPVTILFASLFVFSILLIALNVRVLRALIPHSESLVERT